MINIFKNLNIKKNGDKISSKDNSRKTIRLEDVDRMNDIEKTKLYHTISVQYKDFYNIYYKKMEEIKEYYSLVINNNLDMKYFQKILESCNYVFENVEQYRNLEMKNNKLIGSTDIAKSNSAYT